MNRQDILTLFDYNAWANTRVLGAVESLPAEQFLVSEWIRLRRWHGESPSKGLPAAVFPTVASLRGPFSAVEGEHRAFLDTISEERLAQPFTYRDMAGNQHALPLVHS